MNGMYAPNAMLWCDCFGFYCNGTQKISKVALWMGHHIFI